MLEVVLSGYGKTINGDGSMQYKVYGKCSLHIYLLFVEYILLID